MNKVAKPVDTASVIRNLNPTDKDIAEQVRMVMIDTGIRLAYVDRNFDYLWVTPSYAAGFDLPPMQMIGRSHLDFCPDRRQLDMLQDVIQSGEKKIVRDAVIEYPREHPKASSYWDIYAIPVLGADKNVVGIGLSFLETTERKNYERELERAAAEWQHTFDSVPDSVFILDRNFRIIRANSIFAGLLHARPEDIVGKTCHELVHKSNKPWPKCPLLNAVDSRQTITIEAFEPHFNVYFEVTISPVIDKDGQLIGHVHIARDITQRKHAEDLLQESESRYRIVNDNMEGGVIIYENEKGVYANARASDILGYSREELLNMKTADYVAPRKRAKFDEFVKETTESWTKAARFDEWLVRKDGKKRYIHINYCPVIETEQPPRYFVIFYDFTAQKTAETRMKAAYKKELQLHQQLENEISKRTDFTHALVHELKTPLTPIMTSSEVLARELRGDSVHSRLARNVHWGAVELGHRVDELLELAKIEIGAFKIFPGMVDLLKTIKDTLSFMEPIANTKKQYLKSHLPENIPELYVDNERIRQVLMNLIGNALKYCASHATITVSAKQKNDKIIIEVRDDGFGIVEELKEHLFDPYFRIESSAGHVGGLGLGLFISRTIIELHGGEINVRTRPGKGSTFSFFLPVNKGNGEPRR